MKSNILTSICEYFKLSNMPFLNRSKMPFVFKDYEENFSLLSTVFYNRQIAVITGSAGSGKSSLVFYAMNQLDPSCFRVVTCELSNPKKGPFYKTLAVKMGLNPAFRADDIKLQIIEFLNNENKQGKFNCLIVDEAHTLSFPMIDELRSFYEEGQNFSLILLGLPILIKKNLNLNVTLSMKQRISLYIECKGFSLNEVKNYVEHQFKHVNIKNPIMDESCYPLLHSKTSGIAREINQICYRALLECYLRKQSIINEDIINIVIDKQG